MVLAFICFFAGRHGLLARRQFVLIQHDFPLQRMGFDLKLFLRERQHMHVMSARRHAWFLDPPPALFRRALTDAEPAFTDVGHAGRVHLAASDRRCAFDVVAVGFANQIDIVLLKQRHPITVSPAGRPHCGPGRPMVLRQQPAVLLPQAGQFGSEPILLIAGGRRLRIQRHQRDMRRQLRRVIVGLLLARPVEDLVEQFTAIVVAARRDDRQDAAVFGERQLMMVEPQAELIPVLSAADVVAAVREGDERLVLGHLRHHAVYVLPRGVSTA